MRLSQRLAGPPRSVAFSLTSSRGSATTSAPSTRPTLDRVGAVSSCVPLLEPAQEPPTCAGFDTPSFQEFRYDPSTASVFAQGFLPLAWSRLLRGLVQRHDRAAHSADRQQVHVHRRGVGGPRYAQDGCGLTSIAFIRSRAGGCFISSAAAKRTPPAMSGRSLLLRATARNVCVTARRDGHSLPRTNRQSPQPFKLRYRVRVPAGVLLWSSNEGHRPLASGGNAGSSPAHSIIPALVAPQRPDKTWVAMRGNILPAQGAVLNNPLASARAGVQKRYRHGKAAYFVRANGFFSHLSGSLTMRNPSDAVDLITGYCAFATLLVWGALGVIVALGGAW